MNETKTEELLNSINLTMEEVYKLIKSGINERYKTIGPLQMYTTVDDLAQDVLVYYLSTMKSTGDIRLNYYIKKYHNRQHIVNMLIQTGRQQTYQLMNSKPFIERPYYLEDVVLNEGSSNEDNVQKTKVLETALTDYRAEQKILSEPINDEIVTMIVDNLNATNYARLKNEYEKRKGNNTMPFMLDTKNCLKAYLMTLKQLKIIIDLCNGKSKSSIRTDVILRREFAYIQKALSGEVERYLRTF